MLLCEHHRQSGERATKAPRSSFDKLRLSGIEAPTTVEADDYATLARALGPLNSFGAGHTSPVLTLDQAFPMAEEGAFRAR